MAIAFQIITLGIIVTLGFYLFKKYPIKFNTKELLQIAFLVALALVLSYFSILLALGGFPSLKLGFSQIPLMLLGLLFGPTYGYLSGLAYDILGLIVTPTSFPFFGFTLTNVLVCVLPGFLKEKKKVNFKNLVITILVIYIVLNGSIWLLSNNEIFIENFYALDLKQKILITVGLSIYLLIVFVTMYFIKKKYGDENDLGKIFASVLVIDAGVNLFLNPLWLYVMYSMPFTITLFSRFIKLLVILPLDTIILMALYKVSGRIRKHG